MTTARYIGTCSVCEAEQKVRKDRMVHHGFTRPGWGYILGDCPGVGWPPYELSDEGTRNYQERVAAGIPRLEKVIAYMESHDEPIHVERSSGGYHMRKTWLEEITAEHHEYKAAKRHKMLELRSQLDQAQSEVVRAQRLIDAWRPAKVITVHEGEARDTAEKQAKQSAKLAALEPFRVKAHAKHAKHYKQLEALLPRLTDTVMEKFARLKPENYRNKNRLEEITRRIQRASDPPGDFTSRAAWQDWAKLPEYAVESIESALSDMNREWLFLP